MLLTSIIATQTGAFATNKHTLHQEPKFNIDANGGKFGEPCIVKTQSVNSKIDFKRPLKNFTISLWVNVANSVTWGIITTGNATNQMLWVNDDKFYYYWDTTNYIELQTVQFNTWVHFWITQGDNEQSVYVNGSKVSSSIRQPDIDFLTVLGYGSYRAFNGKLSNYIVWDEEIPFNGIPTFPIGYKKYLYIDQNNKVYAKK